MFESKVCLDLQLWQGCFLITGLIYTLPVVYTVCILCLGDLIVPLFFLKYFRNARCIVCKFDKFTNLFCYRGYSHLHSRNWQERQWTARTCLGSGVFGFCLPSLPLTFLCLSLLFFTHSGTQSSGSSCSLPLAFPPSAPYTVSMSSVS